MNEAQLKNWMSALDRHLAMMRGETLAATVVAGHAMRLAVQLAGPDARKLLDGVGAHIDRSIDNLKMVGEPSPNDPHMAEIAREKAHALLAEIQRDLQKK